MPFDPNNTIQVATLIQNIQTIINLGFQCSLNASNPECTQAKRRKRQSCPNYVVTLIPPVTLVSEEQAETFI
jgi:hypothetical protein